MWLAVGVARTLVNDSYRLDICLLHPPYLIALAAIYIGCAYIKRDVTEWFDLLNVDTAQVGLQEAYPHTSLPTPPQHCCVCVCVCVWHSLTASRLFVVGT